LWPLTVLTIPIKAFEKMERIIGSYAKKWLGVPRCLSSTGLYGHLHLPLSSFGEDFKSSKTRLELTLLESRDTTVRAIVPALTTGRWRAVCPVKVGCQGFIATSTVTLLKKLEMRGQSLSHTMKEISGTAEHCIQWLWMRRKTPSWAPRC